MFGSAPLMFTILLVIVIPKLRAGVVLLTVGSSLSFPFITVFNLYLFEDYRRLSDERPTSTPNETFPE